MSLISRIRTLARVRPMPEPELPEVAETVAIIMDGNGRWAQEHGLPRVEGHRQGAKAVREVVRAAREIGLRALTLYAFSAQNWQRPVEEVATLMQLLRDYVIEERDEIMDNDIRLNAIGQLHKLPGFVRERLDRICGESEGNRRTVLTLALSYDGREEIVQAARRAARLAGPGFSVADMEPGLWTADLPELDLLVRTSGERRISNFLLWQCAYAELAFSDLLWPDFREMELLRVIGDYQTRQRRFGLTGAQVAGKPRGS